MFFVSKSQYGILKRIGLDGIELDIDRETGKLVDENDFANQAQKCGVSYKTDGKDFVYTGVSKVDIDEPRRAMNIEEEEEICSLDDYDEENDADMDMFSELLDGFEDMKKHLDDMIEEMQNISDEAEKCVESIREKIENLKEKGAVQ